MTPRPWLKPAIITLLIVGAVVGHGLYQDHKFEKLVTQSQVSKGKVDALQEQAGSHDDKADELRTKWQEAEAEVLRLKGQLSRRQAIPAAPGAPAVPVDHLRDQIIEAQDQRAEGLKAENTELRTSGELKDKALAESNRRSESLEKALKTTSSYRNSLTGMAGIDLSTGRPVYGARYSHSWRNLTAGGGFIGKTVFVEAGVRW